VPLEEEDESEQQRRQSDQGACGSPVHSGKALVE
jgi:hypothetical protein